MTNELESIINEVIDDDIQHLFGDGSKIIAKMVEQGLKQFVENPFNTSQGQVATSQTENFWARKSREGIAKIYGSNVSATSLNASGTGSYNFVIPEGYKFYPKNIHVKTSDGVGKILMSMNNNDTTWIEKTLVDYGNLDMDFDGEFYFEGDGILVNSITVTGGTADGEFIVRILGVEEAI